MRARLILYPFLLCIVLYLFSGGNILKAQALEAVVPVETGWMGRVLAGPSFLSLPELNASLDNQGYFPLSENFFSMGIGLSRMSNRWIYGGELYNIMLNQTIQNNQLAILNYHYLMLRVGRVVWRKDNRLLIYPEIGFGGGLANLKARPANERFPDNYWTGGPLVDVGVSGSRFVSLDSEKNYFVELGFRIGYLRSFENVWILRGFTSTDYRGEPISPEGLYIRISLGMGMLK